MDYKVHAKTTSGDPFRRVPSLGTELSPLSFRSRAGSATQLVDGSVHTGQEAIRWEEQQMGSAGRYSGGSSMDRCAGSGVTGPLLCSLDSLEDLARWLDEVVGVHRQLILDASREPAACRCLCNGDGPSTACPVAIPTVEALLVAGFDRMRKNGELVVDADPARLAMALTAALEGGSLLARTGRDVTRLEAALDLALSHVRSYSAR